MDTKILKIMENQCYRFKDNSAVKICRWCKKSLVDEGGCYKEKFYGIKSHLCCQMSPNLSCQNKCMHCWRAIELDFNIYPRGAWDDQDFVLNGKKVSIKSAKWFSNWLLLETKDLNRGDTYDYYIFVTVDKDLKSGTIKGFASNNDILKDPKTISLEKGDCIPNTSTKLDAANYARHSNDLKNSIEEWNNLITILNNN